MKRKLPIEAATGGAGFSIIELLMVLLISAIVAAFAIPIISAQLSSYRLKGAVQSATWAIQSTRFQALMAGYPYQVTFSGNAQGNDPAYQIANEATGTTTFSNVGTSVPLSGSAVTLNQSEVFQFKPNGTVITSPASNPPYTFTISYAGTTETITVSNYGDVSVSP